MMTMGLSPASRCPVAGVLWAASLPDCWEAAPADSVLSN